MTITSPDQDHPPAGEDLLPPVQPPSAGFIIQLFVVPALIVLVIVTVWLGFNWLVRRTSMGPEQLIQGLEQGPSIARWQRASDLAFMLPNKRYAQVRRNPAAAAQVAQILARELDRAESPGGMEEHEIQFRYYLTQTLGQFDVPDGVDVLLQAARTKRDPSEWLVRYSAIQSLARRIELNLVQKSDRPEMEAALLQLAEDEDPSVRSATAYALGKLGTPAAVERLEVMADDPDADTRYNAAVALAHHANDKAAETLAEMLDPQQLGSLPQTGQPAPGPGRGAIAHTAIEAVQELARQNPAADLSPVVAALQRLANADPDTLVEAHLPPRLVSEARQALRAIDRQPAESAGP
jgi:HEAT repeat protein